MSAAEPYVGLGPCAFCQHPDAGHRVWDAIADRIRGGDSWRHTAAEFGITVEQVRALAARAGASPLYRLKP